MKKNELFVHLFRLLPKAARNWHILWFSVIYHAILRYYKPADHLRFRKSTEFINSVFFFY